MPSFWRLPLAIGAFSVVVFSAGYLTAVSFGHREAPPIVVERATHNEDYSTVESESAQEQQLTESGASSRAGQVVASVNSDKYHFLDCPGAKQIKEENKIYFASPEAAQAAGFVLAGNCK